MSKKTKIMIVDDHSVVVEGIKGVFKKDPDLEIVGAASDGLKAVPMVKSLKPDIVIMDISLPKLNGVEATRAIKKWNRKIAVIVFSMHRDREYIVSLFKMGISGYVFKDESLDDLILAVKAVREGGTYYSKGVEDILRSHMVELEAGDAAKAGGVRDALVRLSPREKDVFFLLADGLGIREIADRLCISPKTVEAHKYNIMEKVKVKSIPDLTKIAIRKKLIKV